MVSKTNHRPRFQNKNPISRNPIRKTQNNDGSGGEKQKSHKPAMEKLKEAVIKFADSNSSLFSDTSSGNSYRYVIEQRFSQFFKDFQTPNHPPYSAMIRRAISELNEKWGSNEESISKYIEKEYDNLPWAHSTLLKHHLRNLCDCQEICLTGKQCYFIAGETPEPISSSRIDEQQLKRKRNPKWGKKSRKCRKKYEEKKEHQLNVEETNKLAIEIFQEQDQAHQPPDEMTGQQDIVSDDQSLERKDLMIGGERYLQGTSLIDVPIQHKTEDNGLHADTEEGKQLEHEQSDGEEKMYENTKFDVIGNENQSVEEENVVTQIKVPVTKERRWKRKKRLKSKRRSSKCKKHDINEETQLQVWNEVTLEQEKKVTDKRSNGKQSHTIEDSLIDLQTQQQKSVDDGEQNKPEIRQNNVAGEVDKGGEVAEEAGADISCYSQLPQAEEPPNSNPKVVEKKRQSKRVWTRSQLKKTFDENLPKHKFEVVEYFPEELVQPQEQHIEGTDEKFQLHGHDQVKDGESKCRGLRSRYKKLEGNPNAEVTPVRRSLRLSKTNSEAVAVTEMETEQKSRSPSPEITLKELFKPLLKKFCSPPSEPEPAAIPSAIEVLPSENKGDQGPNTFQQAQHPNEEDQAKRQQVQQLDDVNQPKYEGQVMHPKCNEFEKDEVLCNSKSVNSQQDWQSDEKELDQPKHKGRGRPTKREKVEKDEVLCKSRSADFPQKDQQSDEVEYQLKYKGRGRRSKPKKVDMDEEEEQQEGKKAKSRGKGRLLTTKKHLKSHTGSRPRKDQ